MKIQEFKKIFKPIIKECLKEAFLEEGFLSIIIKESIQAIKPILLNESENKKIIQKESNNQKSNNQSKN
jgi:hypothetical protein